MSNAVAVAAVTETLSRIIESAAQSAVSGATISNAPPQAPPPNTPSRVSVYLYQVHESPHFRNDDLPTRNGGGTVVTTPQIALELDYLVSFYGRSEMLERERMLGRVMSTLHRRPLLSPKAIQSAIESHAADPSHFLGDADLHHQVERVRVTPLELDLDQMSKLWSIFFQEPHTLSVSYRVSIVLIEAEDAAQEGLPVQVRQVRAVPVAAPHITGITPLAVAYSPSGASLTLTGTGLAAERVVVFFDRQPAAPQLVTHEQVVAPVPPTLAAGVRVVHVAHMVDWGTPSAPDLRPILESNRVAFALQPVIETPPAAVATPGPLELNVQPELQVGQSVRLVLRETTASAGTEAPASFEVEHRVTEVGTAVEFDLADAPTGEFWLRVAVDGVTSALAFDSSGFTGPKLVVS